MESYENKPCTLSGFIHFCTVCDEKIKVNGEWVKTNRRRAFSNWCSATPSTRYEILNIVLDGHDLIFHLKNENGLVYKSFSIYSVGWVWNTYGMMSFLHRKDNGKEEIWSIS